MKTTQACLNPTTPLQAQREAAVYVETPRNRWRPAALSRRAMRAVGKFLPLAALLALPLLAQAAGDASAPAAVGTDELSQTAARGQVSMNVAWTVAAGFLGVLMIAGFALMETGLCRAKNAAHVVTMNLMAFGIGILGFWAFGFAIMSGGIAGGSWWKSSLGPGLALLNSEWSLSIFGKPFGLMGCSGFFLNQGVFDTAVFCLFLIQAALVCAAVAIPTGAMAERWNFGSFAIYAFWAAALPIALFGNWVHSGWLAELGQNFSLGHGHVDFAGSTTVHMCGGMIALAGAAVLGPRLGKYGLNNGKPRPIPGHNIVYVVLGTLILAVGWLAVSAGSALTVADDRIAIIAANTLIAAAMGTVGAYAVTMFKFGKADPSLLCNGLLAGLVASAAPCAFVSSFGAALIGFVAGVIVIYAIFFVEGKLKIDDPVGAISVHGLCGAWGALSLGLFANGSYGAGWGGVHRLVKGGAVQVVLNDNAAGISDYNRLTGAGWLDSGVTGGLGRIFTSDSNVVNDWSQFGAQCVGTLTCFVFVGAFAYAWFKVSNLFVPIRSKREHEIAGLDLPEMGAECYPDYQLTDKSSPRVH